MTDCSKRFLQQVEIVESVWGELTPPLETKGKPARIQHLASLFLGGVDRQRFNTILDDLNNDHIAGRKNVYPKDVSSAIMLLTNCRGLSGTRQREVEDMSDGLPVMSFAQTKPNGSLNKKCFNCNKKGHIAKDCPELKLKDKEPPRSPTWMDSDDTSVTKGVGMSQFAGAYSDDESIGWNK